MPQLDPTWFASQLFWLFVSFIALYFVLSKVILPPLLEIIARRKETLEGDLARAQALKTEAEQARLDYERALAEARANAQQVMADALGAGKASAEQAGKAIDQQIEEKLATASKQINDKKRELLTALAPSVSDLTSMIVAKLTQRQPSPEQVRAALHNAANSKR